MVVVYTEKSKEDYDSLDNSQRLQVDKAITKIENNGMKTGNYLRGRLSGCNRVKHKKIGLRIIFREIEREKIQIVCISNRGDCYQIAEKRLSKNY